jgi:hypothetical protein
MEAAQESLARRLAHDRLARDRKIAQQAGLPTLLKLEAYLPQCRQQAEALLRFRRV